MQCKLRHLTIKPIRGCHYNCPYCESRQELFRKTREKLLSLTQWASVFKDADDLGCEYLDISGGEPTLYRDLPALIWEAKRFGWFVSLNSTGVGVAERICTMAEVCLDQVIISFISRDPQKHDFVRQTEGSWQVAMRAIRLVSESSLRLIIHLIINRYNFCELPDLIDFAFAQGASGLALVYPENDAHARYLLMSESDIRHFRSVILPECLKRYSLHRPSIDKSHVNLSGLYQSHGIAGDFASGVYWNDFDQIRSKCDKPETFSLIYPNGDVLPCNAVEYTHGPIMGNVTSQSLKEIWAGETFTSFRRERMAFCRLCPIKHHTGVAVHSTDNPPYAAPVIRRIPDTLSSIRPNRLPPVSDALPSPSSPSNLILIDSSLRR